MFPDSQLCCHRAVDINHLLPCQQRSIGVNVSAGLLSLGANFRQHRASKRARSQLIKHIRLSVRRPAFFVDRIYFITLQHLTSAVVRLRQVDVVCYVVNHAPSGIVLVTDARNLSGLQQIPGRVISPHRIAIIDVRVCRRQLDATRARPMSFVPREHVIPGIVTERLLVGTIVGGRLAARLGARKRPSHPCRLIVAVSAIEALIDEVMRIAQLAVSLILIGLIDQAGHLEAARLQLGVVANIQRAIAAVIHMLGCTRGAILQVGSIRRNIGEAGAGDARRAARCIVSVANLRAKGIGDGSQLARKIVAVAERERPDSIDCSCL